MEFLKKYGIDINNKTLLNEALTHSSYSNEHKGINNYERLEFLGDAVLELIISEYLYNNYNLKEGEMTKVRASFVCEKALDKYSSDIGLHKYIKVGMGQMNNINEAIVADVFESVLAVIYLEKGFNTAKEYIYKIVVPYIESNYDFLSDYKTKLQELVQTDKKSLTYEVIKETGEAHNKTFYVEVKINDIVYGKGSGRSKKEAEQNAAKDALNKSAR